MANQAAIAATDVASQKVPDTIYLHVGFDPVPIYSKFEYSGVYMSRSINTHSGHRAGESESDLDAFSGVETEFAELGNGTLLELIEAPWSPQELALAAYDTTFYATAGKTSTSTRTNGAGIMAQSMNQTHQNSFPMRTKGLLIMAQNIVTKDDGTSRFRATTRS